MVFEFCYFICHALYGKKNLILFRFDRLLNKKSQIVFAKERERERETAEMHQAKSSICFRDVVRVLLTRKCPSSREKEEFLLLIVAHISFINHLIVRTSVNEPVLLVNSMRYIPALHNSFIRG